jgi:cholinesterase
LHSYRVNIFGFPSTPSGTSNVGLLDQRLAVEWVRDNIAAFGGNPRRITLFGQSAGAASIDFYSYAWTSDPIVNGFILESGTTQVIPPLNESTSAAMWYNITSQLGCGTATSDPSSTLACMRTANSTSILSVLASAPSFVPTVDNTVVFDVTEYKARSLSGKFIQSPLLIGTNDNEEGIFRISDILHGGAQPSSFYEETNLNKFLCPSAARANFSVYNHVPTWRYRWFGVFNNTNLTFTPDSGAYHGSEIPIIFNTPPSGKGVANNTADELAVMAYMGGAWAAFAKDPVNGLGTYQGGWYVFSMCTFLHSILKIFSNSSNYRPFYDPTNATLIRLAFDPTNSSATNLALPEMYDAGCGTILAVTVSGSSTTTTATGSNPQATGKASSGTVLSTSSSWIIPGIIVLDLIWIL